MLNQMDPSQCNPKRFYKLCRLNENSEFQALPQWNYPTFILCSLTFKLQHIQDLKLVTAFIRVIHKR